MTEKLIGTQIGVRLTIAEREKLEQLRRATRAPTYSEVVRSLIRSARVGVMPAAVAGEEWVQEVESRRERLQPA